MAHDDPLDKILASARQLDAALPRRRPVHQFESPPLPPRRRLNDDERWASLLWSIESAQAHGVHALKGLAVGLARVINAESLQTLIFDARPDRRARTDVDDLLWDWAAPITMAGERADQLMVKARRTLSVDLNEVAVLPQPWQRGRLHRALQNLGAGRAWGAWRQDQNHIAVAWKPWPLVWVSNGNHSTMAALIRGGGRLRCEETFDYSPVLRAVRTDGVNWIRMADDSMVEPVRSMAMAGIFVIGQRLICEPARPKPPVPPICSVSRPRQPKAIGK